MDHGLTEGNDLKDWIKSYRPAHVLNTEGKAVGVEVGYAFERFAYGSSVQTNEARIKRFGKYAYKK